MKRISLNYLNVFTALALAAVPIGSAYAITDTVFKYSESKTGYYGINRGMFVPRNTTAANDFYIGGDPDEGITSAGSQCFVTGVNLPQGSTMARLGVWYSSDAGSNLSVAFKREAFSDGAQVTYFTGFVVSDSGTRTLRNIAIPPADAKINNALYTYMLLVCTQGNSEFYSARITYTYEHAGD